MLWPLGHIASMVVLAALMFTGTKLLTANCPASAAGPAAEWLAVAAASAVAATVVAAVRVFARVSLGGPALDPSRTATAVVAVPGVTVGVARAPLGEPTLAFESPSAVAPCCCRVGVAIAAACRLMGFSPLGAVVLMSSVLHWIFDCCESKVSSLSEALVRYHIRLLLVVGLTFIVVSTMSNSKIALLDMKSSRTACLQWACSFCPQWARSLCQQ